MNLVEGQRPDINHRKRKFPKYLGINQWSAPSGKNFHKVRNTNNIEGCSIQLFRKMGAEEKKVK